MHRSISITLLLVALSLTYPRAIAAQPSEPRDAVAEWLSAQFHHTIDTAQVLSAPADVSVEDCVMLSMRHSAAGTALMRLRCPGQALPQLALLRFSPDSAALSRSAPHTAATRAHSAPAVRAGATLQADLNTSNLHAQLPVVAIQSGDAGDEIRVRVANTNRIMRARILTAHTVAILSAGA